MEVGGWSCPACLTPNQETEIQCAACAAYKPGCKPQVTVPTFTFGGTAAVPKTEWKPPTGPIRFGFATLPSSSNATFSKENDKPSPVFGAQSVVINSSSNVPASRLTFGRSSGGLMSIGDNATGLSTPTKGYRSPQSFCQTMETPAVKMGSPMLIGVGPEIESREVPETVSRMTTGCVWTWGSGECDQLAVRMENMTDDNHRETPIIIKALSTPICDAIAAGSMHSLAVVHKGKSVLSWGCNDEGTLGRPIKFQDTKHIWQNARPPAEEYPLTNCRAPGLVWNLPHDTPIRHVSAGGSHSAAITQSGDCYCWGCYRDQTGNIGFADYKNGSGSTYWYLLDPSELRPGQPIPTLVPHLEGVCIELISGENHTGVLTAMKEGERRIYLWGAAEFGQLGVTPLSLFEQNRTSTLFPIAWSVDRFKFKWPEGQADGTYQLQPHPCEADLKNATLLHLYGGKYVTFFSVDMKGSIETFGFGKNACGELGAGFEQDIVVDPVPLKSVKGLAWSDIRGGEFFSIGLTCDGSVFTWGHREYVGLGSAVAKGSKHVLEPRLVPGLKQRVVAIEAAHRTAFALTEDGQLFAWGESTNFQIGDGLSYEDPVTKPLRVHPKLFDYGYVFGMAGGAQHTLALVKPCPEEVKAAELSRAETSNRVLPMNDVAVEQRGKKRAREDGDDEADLTERKKARHKDHQVNTDQLPNLANPLANTGPPSTTLQVPPPTPTESNELKKLSTLSDIELPTITEVTDTHALQCESDIEGSDTPVRKPREEVMPIENADSTTLKVQEVETMDDGKGDGEDVEANDNDGEVSEDEPTSESSTSSEEGDEEVTDEEGDNHLEVDEPEQHVEAAEETQSEEEVEDDQQHELPKQSQSSETQERATRGRRPREKATVIQKQQQDVTEKIEPRQTRAASRVSAKKAPTSRVTRGTGSRTSGKAETKAEKVAKVEKPTKASNAKDKVKGVTEKNKRESAEKKKEVEKKEAVTRKSRQEKKDEHKKEEPKNEKKRSLSKSPPEDAAPPPTKRSRSRKAESKSEAAEVADNKRVTRGKKVESEPPPPTGAPKENARAASSKQGAATRSRRGSKSKVDDEASQHSQEAVSESEAQKPSRVTRKKAEQKKQIEPKAKAKAKATVVSGSTRRKGSTGTLRSK